jgi:nucleoside-diphosphate-sugar epimerase
MRILFTGASSFSGLWFVRELAAAGHEVVMPLRRRPEQYDGVRRARVERLAQYGRVVPECTFGEASFLSLVQAEPAWDLFCHHAADVTNYKSPDFDVVAAVANNTRGLTGVLDALASKGCRRVLLTGSVFEHGEGAGSQGLPAFSPYGLSKALTAEIFQYYARVRGLRLGKFVIANPFGPFEEPRFTTFLAKNWFAGATPKVQTPLYVRDNMPVALMGKLYARFAAGLPAEAGFCKVNPSGYVESQGTFAQRFASEMRPRLGLPCNLELGTQTDFSEPRVRINTDVPDLAGLNWDESRSWDELAAYYKESCAQ